MRIGIDASRAFVKERTGTENYSYQMIRHLLALPEARDHEWILYAKSQTSRKQVQSCLGDSNQVNWELRVIPLAYLWTQMGLAARTWTDNLDVLWVPAHTLPVLRRPGVRTVVTIHGIEYEYLPSYENKLQRWYLPLSTKYAVMSARRIIAVSEFTKRQLVERLGADPKKIEVVYEGVDAQRLDTRNQRSEVLRKYGLDARRYVLFIGTVQPRKNLVRLIEAFSRLSTKQLAFSTKLVICGKMGWQTEEILSASKRYSVSDLVIFTGYINDDERYILLQNALVYIQPSITEGFGLPILEAFAAGAPVVSSSGGALPEISNFSREVGPHSAGQLPITNLFDPYDVDEMRQVLQRAIDDKKWREELIDKGKARLKDFGWEKAAKETYRMLVNN